MVAMVCAEVERTLVKSPPELWAELSDPAALSRHLGELGEIRITRVEPEHKVEWAAGHARGTVLMKASAWGTRVTLTATADAPDDSPADGADAADHIREAPSDGSDARRDRADIPPRTAEPGGQGGRMTGESEPAIAQTRMDAAPLASAGPLSTGAEPLRTAGPDAGTAHAAPAPQAPAEHAASAGAAVPCSPLAVEQHMPLPRLWEREPGEESDETKPLDGVKQQRGFFARIFGHLRRREPWFFADPTSGEGSPVSDDQPAAHESPALQQPAPPDPQQSSVGDPSAGPDPQPQPLGPPTPEPDSRSGPDPQPQPPAPPSPGPDPLPGPDPQPPTPRPEPPAPKPIDIIRVQAGGAPHAVSQQSGAPLGHQGGGEDTTPREHGDAEPEAHGDAEPEAHADAEPVDQAAEEMTALLTSVLDRLGAAHHRPFSRS